ncbi:MAG: hypothetical protein QOD99_266 [Chthoniobacter sp.]|nr:hypothetical protein [Chthoniobacter sp.]
MKFALLLLLPLSVFAQIAPESVMKITSPDFGDGGNIPKRFTCDDQNVNPTLQITGAPAAAKSLALIVDDPDAPGGTFTHWLLWNLPAKLEEIIAASTPNGAVQGSNGFGKKSYGGPCPPSGQHRYYFRLYALDIPVSLAAGASRKDLEKTMEGHILNQAVIMGKYARPETQR